MATRIAEVTARLRGQGRAGLVPFLSVGDPDLATSREALLAVAEAGADIIELGVPFSDPIADGPVIQESSQRALRAGSSLPRVLEMVAWLRERTDVPLVLFGYYNPFFRYGDENLARDAKAAGADAVLCSDLPPEEAADLVAACRQYDLDRIFLLAPTSDDSRMRAVAGLPIGVGFGISSAEQAASVARYADLVIVGSALVRRVFEAGPGGAVAAARDFVAELRRGIDGVRKS